ncbi:MAG: bifunctional 4-hydroxy-2-oxoglutarate aldolase/2-dehydro-3-deoxy-phosphogluconate aldolase [Deltaproteobacteria bacterium]|nr:bifunctional 4-hydroxy-2-oxoglutarate aldolase/2-dehydro-3-deoxy-phosphogluconate aldolase [Deltaproteobacteria bacterium]
MEKRRIFDKLVQEKFIPLIRSDSKEEALKIAEAIKEGGASFLEVTMTVPGAFEVIRELSKTFGDSIIVGAGTVLDVETARLSLAAGARFIVTPTVNIDVIELGHRYSVITIIGAMTLTEILQCWNAGADLVKIFPASLLGGPNYIRAIKGPLPQVDLVPSGGISVDLAPAYIEAGATAVAVGSEITKTDPMDKKRFDTIKDRTSVFLRLLKGAKSAL